MAAGAAHVFQQTRWTLRLFFGGPLLPVLQHSEQSRRDPVTLVCLKKSSYWSNSSSASDIHSAVSNISCTTGATLTSVGMHECISPLTKDDRWCRPHLHASFLNIPDFLPYYVTPHVGFPYCWVFVLILCLVLVYRRCHDTLGVLPVPLIQIFRTLLNNSHQSSSPLQNTLV